MSKIKNGGLDQYGADPFEQRQLEQLALKKLITIDTYGETDVHSWTYRRRIQAVDSVQEA